MHALVAARMIKTLPSISGVLPLRKASAVDDDEWQTGLGK
jgi:hypothetical protein